MLVTNERNNCIIRSFSGANTGNGFVSFYDEIFSEETFDGLYIIKGGPGTGKSTFMKNLAKRAEELGYSCRQYLCGSDSNSLDGVTVSNSSRKIGVLDGTPPHPKEFRSPGAAGDILNFGDFWDSSVLKSARREIDAINREKSACFETAYRYLGAADKINRHISSLASGVYLKEKAYATASRLVSSIGTGGTVSNVQLIGFTMNGKVSLSPTGNEIKEYAVSGNDDVAHLFLADIVHIIQAKGVSAKVSRSPLNLSDIDGVYFPDSNVWLHAGTGDDADKIINTSRFVDREALSLCRQKMRFGKKCRQALLDGAFESLESAKAHHFALEEIYKANMNFDGLNRQSEIWYSEILSRLDG